MIDFEVNQQAGKKISAKFWKKTFSTINKVLKLKAKVKVSVGIVGTAQMKKFNKAYRGKDKVTDVLSFGEQDGVEQSRINDGEYLGEIIICYSEALRKAKITRCSLDDELKLLTVHGFLHLLGYDHIKNSQAAEMEALEDRILRLQ